jgi:hypothetical protein
MDEELGELDTQWTDAAKASYERRTEEFIEAIRQHVALNLARKGRQKELLKYVPSQEGLLQAARSFADAEFDWCGSFPLPLPADDEWEDDEDSDDEDSPGGGSVLSVVGRWDYRITDEDALIACARAAYLRAWPEDTGEDAEFRIRDAGSAAGELLHGDDLKALNSADGLEAHQFAVDVITHEGADDFDDDPFGIVRRDQGSDL